MTPLRTDSAPARLLVALLRQEQGVEVPRNFKPATWTRLTELGLLSRRTGQQLTKAGRELAQELAAGSGPVSLQNNRASPHAVAASDHLLAQVRAAGHRCSSVAQAVERGWLTDQAWCDELARQRELLEVRTVKP